MRTFDLNTSFDIEQNTNSVHHVLNNQLCANQASIYRSLKPCKLVAPLLVLRVFCCTKLDVCKRT